MSLRRIYCPCGCGEIRRAPLPPLAERLRRRRRAEIETGKAAARIAAQREALEQAIRAHFADQQAQVVLPETRH